MKANETSLIFMKGDQTQYIIPFFQRKYVWEEENWERLLDSLNSGNSSHYLGSIIIKLDQKNDEGFFTYLIIDGQQRITTLSILMRALMDNIGTATVKNELSSMLFCRHDTAKGYSSTINGKSNSVVKLIPGFHDKDIYKLLITDPEEAISKYPNDRLIACYNYFKNATQDRRFATNIYRLLVDITINFIVKIELEANDNAQAIFDVSNGTGVSLTCADIIKNDIFLHIVEQKRLSIYKDTWEKVFDDNEDYAFWTTVYNSRTNIENLLFAVAQIEKNGTELIYDANNDTYDLLSNKYKEHFSSLSQEQLELFIYRLMKYAKIYRNYFTVDKNNQFSQADLIPRYMLSFSNLNACTVLFPFLLKVFYNCCNDDGQIIDGKEPEVINYLKKTERVLIRANIIHRVNIQDNRYKPSTKNFNKTVTRVVDSLDPEDLFTKEQLSSINDDNMIKEGLKNIDNNTAKILLFLLNLKLVDDMGERTNTRSYAYNYELEHIMPQEFKTHWGLPTKDVNGNDLDATIDAEEYRKSFVYQIGNMTIITPKANKTIKNYGIRVKIEGDPSRKTRAGIRKGYQGYSMFASEPVSSELIKGISDAGYIWNERMIAERTNRITDEVLTIWA